MILGVKVQIFWEGLKILIWHYSLVSNPNGRFFEKECLNCPKVFSPRIFLMHVLFENFFAIRHFTISHLKLGFDKPLFILFSIQPFLTKKNLLILVWIWQTNNLRTLIRSLKSASIRSLAPLTRRTIGRGSLNESLCVKTCTHSKPYHHILYAFCFPLHTFHNNSRMNNYFPESNTKQLFWMEPWCIIDFLL